MNEENFSPFLWALTSRSCPSPIFVVGLTGVAYWLRTGLPEEIALLPLEKQKEFVKQAITEKHAWLAGSPFGNHAGYIFIRTSDEFHHFDTAGNYVGLFEGIIPHILEGACLNIRQKNISRMLKLTPIK